MRTMTPYKEDDVSEQEKKTREAYGLVYKGYKADTQEGAELSRLPGKYLE